MESAEMVRTIRSGKNDNKHQKEITESFHDFSREVLETLPEGSFTDLAVEKLQEAWLYAREAIGQTEV